jgi:uncharacterized protein YkwD
MSSFSSLDDDLSGDTDRGVAEADAATVEATRTALARFAARMPGYFEDFSDTDDVVEASDAASCAEPDVQTKTATRAASSTADSNRRTGHQAAADLDAEVLDGADPVEEDATREEGCFQSSSSSSALAAAAAPQREHGLSHQPLDHELFELTNAYRHECKVHPLQWHRGLARIARDHAVMVADGSAPFSHAGAKERFSQCETKCVNIAENLARSDGFDRADIPGAVLSGWRNSEGHRRNLLGPFDVCGIGFAVNDAGTIFVTQMLALLDEDSAKRSRAKAAAVEALTSTPAVFAVAGLVLRGPLLAVAGGFLGSTMEKRFGFRASAVPQVVCRKASELIAPAACARCGVLASQGSELHVSSRSEVGRQAFCTRCLPPLANQERSNSDVWNFVV